MVSNIQKACSEYFNGFTELLSEGSSKKTKFIAFCKVASYFITIGLLPLGFVLAREIDSLLHRKIVHISTVEENSDKTQPSKHIKTIKKTEELVNPSSDETSIQKVIPYPGDLTQEEKVKIDTEYQDRNTLNISFIDVPSFSFTIRNQDIFESGAEVIVNAANTHLGGGGGIDGAIHLKGEEPYRAAHKSLKEQYQSKYVRGYAEMIESGKLNDKFHISHVIVVAGPVGPVISENGESQLYSCYFNSLLLAHLQKKTSIAFPSISTGIFNFPKDRAAAISLKAVKDFINLYPDSQLNTISIHFLNPKGLEDYDNAAEF